MAEQQCSRSLGIRNLLDDVATKNELILPSPIKAELPEFSVSGVHHSPRGLPPALCHLNRESWRSHQQKRASPDNINPLPSPTASSSSSSSARNSRPSRNASIVFPERMLRAHQTETQASSGKLLPLSNVASAAQSTYPRSGIPNMATSKAASHESNPKGVVGWTPALGLPVDVDTASSKANEKRKRNAAASSKFRKRRKEREQEHDREITTLQSNINYYRGERDFFRELVLTNGLAIPLRPPSPQRNWGQAVGESTLTSQPASKRIRLDMS